MSGKVLVTGGAGFLGRYVAQSLAEEGFFITVLDDLSSGNADMNAEALRHPAITKIVGSMFDKPLVTKLTAEHPIIIHFASVVGVEETIEKTILTMKNIEGTISLVEALTPEHTVLFGSSADVYGIHSHFFQHPMKEDDWQVFEKSSVNRWVYPKVKSLEENLIGGSLAKAINVRIFNSFGPGMDFPNSKRVVPHFIEKMCLRQPLPLSMLGQQIRTLCYYKDMVRGLLLALHYAESQSAPFKETINLGGEKSISIKNLAELMIESALHLGLIEKRLPLEFQANLYSQSFDDTWNRTPDISKAKALLGYQPKIGLDEAMAATLLSYQDAFVHPEKYWPNPN
jgi:nucleoside-diphosphate-sugar epimerase